VEPASALSITSIACSIAATSRINLKPGHRNINGIGINSLSFTDNILSRPQTIKVEIVSGSRVLASDTVSVIPVVPTIAIYEDNPLYGFMFHQEIDGGYTLEGQEITFAAFPLFFDALDRTNNSLEYVWQTNAGDTENRSSVTYRTLENVSGAAEVTLSVSNASRITQNASEKFLIQFGQ